MNRQLLILSAVIVLGALAFSGCSPTQHFYFLDDCETRHYIDQATKIEYPDVDTCTLADVRDAAVPFSLDNMHYDSIWNLSLEEAVRYALQNAKVMRTLGGRFASTGGPTPQVGEAPNILLSNPNSVPTVYDPGIQETLPQGGVEAALSEFDAQLTGSFVYDRNDHQQNVQQSIVNSQILRQDQGATQLGITKRTVTGATFSITSNTVYTDSNVPSRQTQRDWSQNIEAAFRQPLLAGGGLQYNRIAGPFDPFVGGGSAAFDGVVLARINTDITLAQFEAGVRNLVSDVENAYWELYYGYRDLESRKIGRDTALEAWRKVNSKVKEGEEPTQREAQARVQYFTFRQEVETALANVYKAENRLRYIMGLSATDGRLIRPCDEPTTARVVFDWNELHCEGLVRSVELREQKWRVKQRELELIAARNLLQPHLDAIGRYRRVGLGENLLGESADNFVNIQGTSAVESLGEGDFNEYEIGLQFTMAIGFRKELSTVRNEQMLLARERARLQDEELELSHQLSDAVRDLATHYQVMQTQFNRLVAAKTQLDAETTAYENSDKSSLDLLLEAQRNRVDAETAYYRALVDYNRAIAQIHFRKGSLLEYNGVYLAEGPWPAKAYFDATKRARERDAATYMNYGKTRPSVISRGPVEQFERDISPQLVAPLAAPQNAPEEIRPGKVQPQDQGPNAGRTAAGNQAATRAEADVAERPTRKARETDARPDERWTKPRNESGARQSASPARQVNYEESTPAGAAQSDADQSAADTNRSAAGWKRIQR